MLLSSLSVMIVDDDPDHGELLADFVRDCKHRAFLARNATEALALARGIELDVIFMDLVMPEVDGFELVQELRGSGVTCRIVATSGFGGNDARFRAHQSGVDAFLLKPFQLSRIRSELEEVAASRTNNARK